MKIKYPYSNDSAFLTKIDNQRFRKQYVKLILLDWNENPIDEIQGYSTSGTLSINGDSACRQTCNVSMYVPNEEYEITNINNLISINKKIYLEIGIENEQMEYQDHKIIWFPQGLFCITSCSLTHSSNGRTLSLQLRDKMCLLDGSCGGTIPAATQFDEYETIDENGEWIIEKPVIEQIIRELVHHFGGEQPGKIIISDIPARIKAAMKWIGDTPLYKYYDEATETNPMSYGMTTDLSAAQTHAGYEKYEYGQDVGFIYTDFTYPSELIANAGDSVVTILDKIKNTLGTNFEYFYDADGNFIFREKKNFLNTTQATIELENMQNSDYIVDMAKGKSVYDFNNSPIVSSFASTPRYSEIKNDFIVWGIRKSDNGVDLPIRYHLAIDQKPKTGNIYSVYFYTDPDDGLEKAKAPMAYANKEMFPVPGTVGLLYLDKNMNAIYIWNPDIGGYETVSGISIEKYKPNQAGNEGIIYIDSETKQRYYWGTDENSDHYLSKEIEKKNAYQAYLDIIAPIEANIAADYALLGDIDATLSNINMTIPEMEQEIEENNRIIQEATDNISSLNETLAQLEEDYNNTTIEAEREQIQEQMQAVTNSIAEEESVIATLETRNSQLEEIIASIPELSEEQERLLTEIETLKRQMQEALDVYNATIARLEGEAYEYLPAPSVEIIKVKTTDWRTELYLQGSMSEPLGLDSNYYYAELAAEWPKLYDLKANVETINGEQVYTGAFRPEVLAEPWKVSYFLDFIDSTSAISQFSVNAIGRRTLIKSEDSYNCVFEPEIPDFVLIESGQIDAEKNRLECENRGQAYIQIPSSIYTMLAIGGELNGCFTEIKNLLYNHTQYNETIQLQGMPIFHIEPNSRISVQDKDANIYGDYLVTTMSIPLTISGTMSLSATKMIDKL